MPLGSFSGLGLAFDPPVPSPEFSPGFCPEPSEPSPGLPPDPSPEPSSGLPPGVPPGSPGSSGPTEEPEATLTDNGAGSSMPSCFSSISTCEELTTSRLLTDTSATESLEDDNARVPRSRRSPENRFPSLTAT